MIVMMSEAANVAAAAAAASVGSSNQLLRDAGFMRKIIDCTIMIRTIFRSTPLIFKPAGAEAGRSILQLWIEKAFFVAPLCRLLAQILLSSPADHARQCRW